MLLRWKSQVLRLKVMVYALFLAYRDPRTPLLARIVAACVVGYAISPIDLIPDPIPILGYLDDLILIPLGVALAIKLMPAVVWSEAVERSNTDLREGIPTNWIVVVGIVLIWVAVAGIGIWVLLKWL